MEHKYIKFSGDSDDNFNIFGNAMSDIELDYVDAFDKRVIVTIKDKKTQDGIVVIGEYAMDGLTKPVWVFGATYLDDGTPFPDNWKIDIVMCTECQYSPLLQISMPIDADFEISAETLDM